MGFSREDKTKRYGNIQDLESQSCRPARRLIRIPIGSGCSVSRTCTGLEGHEGVRVGMNKA